MLTAEEKAIAKERLKREHEQEARELQIVNTNMEICGEATSVDCSYNSKFNKNRLKIIVNSTTIQKIYHKGIIIMANKNSKDHTIHLVDLLENGKYPDILHYKGVGGLNGQEVALFELIAQNVMAKLKEHTGCTSVRNHNRRSV